MTMELTREQLLRLLDGQRVEVDGVEIKGLANPRWQKMRRVRLDREMLLQRRMQGATEVPREVWHNDQYEVMVFDHPEGVIQLSIKRFDRAPIRNWRHMQQMKNEIVGAEREALELYPRESRVMDNANQYHLWVAPENADVPIGFPTGFALIREPEVAAFNHAPHSGRQEPLQRGLTVGRKLDNARTPEHDAMIGGMLAP